MKTLMAIFLMAVATACEKSDQKDCIDEDLINEEAVCTMDYNPVCGCDGKTYSNPCVATNAGVTSFEKGACDAESD